MPTAARIGGLRFIDSSFAQIHGLGGVRHN
jgi:hypothetical protein